MSEWLKCLVVCCIAFSAAGCAATSGSASAAAWQESLEAYVREQGRGDIEILRARSDPAERPMFVRLGGIEAEGSRDVGGLLLGRPTIMSQPWAVFLVGAASKGKIENIHVAALHIQDGRYIWRKSEPSEAMTKRYQEASIAGQAGSAILSPAPFEAWRRGAEVFDMTVNGTVVAVTHAASGATWRVDIRGDPPRNAVAAAADRDVQEYR